MEIISLVDWDEVEDREILAQFLKTRTGQRFLPKIAESVPPLLGKGDTNEILIRNGEVRGFQNSLRLILELASTAAPIPQGESGAYAAPEDDSAWADGKKIS